MKPLLCLAPLLAITGSALAADTGALPLGNTGPPATIVARAGIGTDAAWASMQVAAEDAAAHCEATDGDRIDACTTELLAAENGRLHTITADCSTGLLTAPDRQDFSRSDTDGQTSWQDQQGTTMADGSLDRYWTVLCAADHEATAAAERQAEMAREAREAEIAMMMGALGLTKAPPAAEPAAAEVALASEPLPVPRASRADSIVGIDHNGSLMWHDAGQGVLYYDRPKASLSGMADRGTILFQGEPWSFDGDFTMRGTAYTFRKGCAPAPYAVEGGFVAGGTARPDRIVLRGASPIRAKGGCAILGYTNDSPNAELVFQLNYGDV